ncbi:uncharacterized protein YtpQ (UPF0354 family) [Aneurinibacillus soli]|uniref:Uncharacterized protein n=1 Tax=Aneurinibacillus soli TaxID=1500254 RepID=A0A0U5B3G9_9BACL|nr:DUF1444 family protein [Aneurinibacillus soli]PYE59500.1 uncharacterized protein YtpQ (UPF0354 family) [Aneurinibacillus soli]BAU29170.1 hypothetical protein CB4_03351 [Aneurinibacillus soli]
MTQKNEQQIFQQRIQQLVIERLAQKLPSDWRALVGKVDTEIALASPGREDMAIQLAPLLAKVEGNETEEEALVFAFADRVAVAVREAGSKPHLMGQEEKLYPVLRHPSFLKEKASQSFVHRKHTAETVVLYALELEAGYTLITEDMLTEAGMSAERLHTYAVENLTRLGGEPRRDQVGDHVFYFYAFSDSYSASRVLNTELMTDMASRINGKMGVAVPHQDVLIIADMADAKGAYMLAQIAVDFSMRGDVPITSLPFMYVEGEIEPYMVMRNPKQRHRPTE